MKKFKKLLAVLLSVVFVASCFAACSKSEESDLQYIKDKGTLVIGITEYEPMNYKDENGNWTGFDTEFAQAVCENSALKLSLS